MAKLLQYTLLCYFILVGKTFAQSTPDDDNIYTAVEEMPEPKEGYIQFTDYIEQNIRYPQEAIEKNITGYVFIRFIVEKDGSISRPTILKGIGYGCDEEVLRVFKNMPKWQAGKEKGKKVRVQMTFPIIFRF